MPLIIGEAGKAPFRLAKRWVAPVLLTGAVAAFALLSSGCQGSPGPAGLDAKEYDHTPPDVHLVYPPAGYLALDDTLSLAAAAFDSGGAVDHVSFLVNGSSLQGANDSAVVADSPYVYLWRFSLGHTAKGPVTITSIAWDTAGNSQIAAPIFIQRHDLTGTDTLTHDEQPGSLTNVRLPAEVQYNDGISTVRFVVDRVSTRFSVRTACRLLGMKVYLADRPGLPSAGPVFQHPSDFQVILYNVTDLGRPGTARDSVLVSVDPFELDNWVYVDLSGMNGGAGYTFERDDSFHLGVAPDVAYSDTLDQGLVLQAVKERFPSVNPDTEPSCRFEESPGRGWISFAQVDTTGIPVQLYLRAVVDYGDGTLGELVPGANAQQNSENRTVR